MAGLKCPGCKRSFPGNKNFSSHKSKCRFLVALAQKKSKSKKSDVKTILDRKKAKIHRRRSQTSEKQTLSVSTSPTSDPKIAKQTPKHPKAYLDELPPAPPYIPQMAEMMDCSDDNDKQGLSSSEDSGGTEPFETDPDNYGVFRIYGHRKPSITPDQFHSISDVSNAPHLALGDSRKSPLSRFGVALERVKANVVQAAANFFSPFQNASVFRLMSWFYRSSNTKSITELNSLVHDVLLAPDFQTEDLLGFDAKKENTRLDNYHEDHTPGSPPLPFSFDDKWIKSTVEIPVPCRGFRFKSEAEAPKFKIEVHHRKITELVKSAYAEAGSEKFHTFPFKAYWKPSEDEPAERIYSEIFTANAWNDQFEEILQSTPDDSRAHLERFMIGLMIWSDSTHLAQFGNAELWPSYIFIGGQSKYDRVKPSSFAAHHLAYMPKASPKLDDSFQEWYMDQYDEPASAEMLTHIRRELAQAVWLLILDEDFVEAYVHGLELKLADGVDRLGLLRLVTYSADYVEKVLMACIKYLSQCACPRCLVLKSKFPMLGSKRDMQDRIKLKRVDDETRREAVEFARKLIFEKGAGIGSKRVADIMGPESLVPTRNAFSERLSEFGLNYFELFVVDLLHEFELGVWMAIFKHLLRLLYAIGEDGIQKMNERFRQIPTFGRGTIRRFGRNSSSLKKMAARDYEDLLQCAIPVFEGLFPPKEDAIVRKLLFELATWHALAKLRLHTETTVKDLETSTTRLGENLRTFQKDVCDNHITYDLPPEEAAKGRRRSAINAKKSTAAQKKKDTVKKPTATRRPRVFLLNTVKLHALGGYAKAIRLYGTTDNYSSQTGEFEHRRVKRMYRRVHKGKHILGIGIQVRRERYMHLLQQQKTVDHAAFENPPEPATVPFDEEETLPATQPEQRYHIAKDDRHKISLLRWLEGSRNDPALNDFLPRLKNHLLSRLLGLKYDGDELNFMSLDRRSVIIENNTIFRHKIVRVNCTTYDLRRDQDSLNPRVPGHADFMVLSPENEEDNSDPHPYWYGRILGIFHANVRHTGPKSKSREPQRMDFLFVRWFGRDMTPKAGWKAKRLIRLGFVPGNDEAAFGFIDPAQIIRAVHLIPAFHWGLTTKYLPSSPIARGEKNPNEDWQLYYVGMFADRDMMMRFRGGGVGHKATRQATDYFKKDRDRLDHEKFKPPSEGEDQAAAMESETEETELTGLRNNEEDQEVHDEEEDFGIAKTQAIYSDSEEDEDVELDNPEEEDFGPEGNGTEMDPELEDLGYDVP